MAKRSKRRHRGASGRANNDLSAHIRSLGMETISEYQAWCRKRGLSGGLNKFWRERREERGLAEQDRLAADADAELREHYESLGLESADEYQAWRQEHGFGGGFNTSRNQRERESAYFERQRAENAMASARRLTSNPEETIRRLFKAAIARDDLPSPAFELVYDVFERTDGDPGWRKALLRTLLHVEKAGDLFYPDPVVAQFGDAPGNSYIDGLAALAARHEQWIIPVEAWRPDAHNRRRQFGSLARHLLALYDVPAFMDTAWFMSDSPEARVRQHWFIHVGTGGNIRKADKLPLQMTKKMAHLFLSAPKELTVDEAMRWTQVVGMGGSEDLARVVLETRLGRSFENEDFWASVVKFLVYNPMLDTAYVEPIVEYIYSQKYAPQEIPQEAGRVELGDPPHPGFSMRTRKMDALLEEVEAWRGRQEAAERSGTQSWEPCGMGEYEATESFDGGEARWTIRELLTTKALAHEGKSMSHCVSSYAQSCRSGSVSVWSIGLETPDERGRRRVMTVAVKNTRKIVTQARGKRNAHPLGSQRSKYHKLRLREAYKVMREWAKREGVTVPKHI